MLYPYRLCPDGLYSFPVDIWSCGCILAEMLGRNPLFPGKTFIHQLSLVFDVIGSPRDHEVKHIINSEARSFLQSQKGKKKVAFSTLYPRAEPAAWTVLDATLAFEPHRRCTVDDLLQSPYLSGVGSPESLVFPPVSSEFQFPFENAEITRHQLKQLLLAEITSFRREHYPTSARESNRSHRTEVSTTEQTSKTTAAATAEAKTERTLGSSTGGGSRRGSHRDGENSHKKDNIRRGSSQQVPPAEEKISQPVQEENIPSYLRGTGNFKSRAVSAPRPRAGDPPKPSIAHGATRATSRRRGSEAKEVGDDVSLTSGSVYSRASSTSRPRKKVVPTTVGIAARRPHVASGHSVAEGDGDETPRRSSEFQQGMVTARPTSAAAHQRSAEKISPAKVPTQPVQMEAVRSSTMRNLLDMCDELYADSADARVSTVRDTTTARDLRADSKEVYTADPYHREASTAKEDKTSVPLSPQAARPLHHNSSDAKTGSQWGGVVPTAAAALPGSGSIRSSYESKQETERESENRAQAKLSARYASAASVVDSASKLTLDDDVYVPRKIAHQHVVDSEADTASEQHSCGSEEDHEDEDLLTPVPRSPVRKSILETYTSPTRLKSTQPSGSPLQQRYLGSDPVLRSPGRENTGTLSLAQRLAERTRQLEQRTAAATIQAERVPSSATTTQDHTATSYVRADTAAEEAHSSSSRYRQTEHNKNTAEASSHTTTTDIHEHHSQNPHHPRKHSDPPPQAAPVPAVAERTRKYTVAKSPKFSQMSWQKRRDQQREAEEKQYEQLLQENKRKSLPKPAQKASSNGNYFGYQAPKRSDSAVRQRR